jgi:hypothetical protein
LILGVVTADGREAIIELISSIPVTHTLADLAVT